jgi:hypothetical protein
MASEQQIAVVDRRFLNRHSEVSLIRASNGTKLFAWKSKDVPVAVILA